MGFEDEGEGGEEKVDVRIHESHVGRKTQDDGREEEHLGWPRYRPHEQHSSREVSIQFALVLVLSGLFLKLLGFVVQELGGVCFAQKQKREDRRQAGKDCQEPKYPPPSGCLGEEASCYWSEGGTQHGAHHKDCHGFASLLWRHDVGDGATTYCQSSGACAAGQESESCEHGQAGAQGASDGEGDEEDIGDIKDDIPAPELRRGRKNKGTDAETKNVDRDGERGQG